MLVVLGGGAHHGGTTDVDELDRGVRGERVQVRHHEVDGVDAVRLEVGLVLGLGAVGQDAAVDLRVEGLDAPAQHLGRAGHLGDLGVRDAGLGQPGRGVAAGHQLPAQVREALGQLDQPLLVVDGQQCPHDVISSSAPSLVARRGPARGFDLPAGLQLVERPCHRRRIERALDHLDPLVQRLLGVAGEDGNGSLGQDRPGVHLEGSEVHRAARLGDPGGQRVPDAVPPGEGGEQGGVRVQDAVRKGAVDGLGQHRAEAGHRHQVHLVRHQRGGDRGGEPRPVEVGAEAAVGLAVDELGGGAVLLGQREAGAGPVGQDDRDGEAGAEHRLEDRPGTRDKDREAHVRQSSGNLPAHRGRGGRGPAQAGSGAPAPAETGARTTARVDGVARPSGARLRPAEQSTMVPLSSSRSG